MPTCAFVSFRLGLTDGVSVVAESWRSAFEDLGYATFRVAGAGPVERLVPGLELGADRPPERGDVERALTGVDLVVIENLCTIPLNLPASRVVSAVLAGRPAILHHHDPPWQRPRFAEVTELPPRDEAWRHVTINELTRKQMAERGIEATTIYNGFELTDAPGDRRGTRELLDVAPDELLVGHPVRAIARKGIPTAIELCEALDATYWLLGEPEEDYDDALATIVSRARCRVIRRPLPHGPDIYAAPDLVAFPSTWEGFGNPPIEAAVHRRMTAVGDYPLARELAAFGFRWLDASDPRAVRAWLDRPDPEVLERNRELVGRHLSHEVMTDRLRALLDDAGWLP